MMVNPYIEELLRVLLANQGVDRSHSLLVLSFNYQTDFNSPARIRATVIITGKPGSTFGLRVVDLDIRNMSGLRLSVGAGMTNFEQTDERCGTCGKQLVIDQAGHYVCLKCERRHPCLQSVGISKFNEERRRAKQRE